MKVVGKISSVRKIVRKVKIEGKKVGFVPTMGYFHKGHISLMEKARKECDFVVVSVFVNPIQFGKGEDYNRYPRDIKRDKEMAQKVGVDLLFCPDVEEMYPVPFLTKVSVGRLTEHLCGAFREGHFDGVCTVVAKLFNIVEPDIAYFGQKDLQQAQVVQQMVRDLNFPIKIRVLPIVREEDGLAMSSRNTYLSERQRKDAVKIYQLLKEGAQAIEKGKSLSYVRRKIKDGLAKCGGRVDYVEIVDIEDMQPIKNISGRDKVAIAVAVWFGKARLIDNIIVKLK